MVTRIRQHNSISARNFIHEQAQARLKEVVVAAQQIATNSVFVHATPVIYFTKQDSGTMCGCRKKVVNGDQMPVDTTGSLNSEYEIDLEAPLFRGFGSSAKEQQPEMSIADDDLDVQNNDNIPNTELPNHGNSTFDSIFGNSIACPICFRSGVVPGYQAVGYSRLVFSSVFVEDSVGYSVDSGRSIPRFDLFDKQLNYIEFDLTVPLIFKSVQFAAYDDQTILRKIVFSIDGHIVSETLLHQYRGKTVKLHVSGLSFTHCVFLFKINKDVIADFPQDSKPKDYATFDTTQPMTIVLDISVPKISTSDILYKVGYDQFWKINDFDYFRTSDKTVIGWTIQARILQKDEIGQMLMLF